MTQYWWVGVVLAVIILGVWFWWHSKRSKGMADKPKPKP